MSKVKITYEFEAHEVEYMQEHMMLHGSWFTDLLEQIRITKQAYDKAMDWNAGESDEAWEDLGHCINHLEAMRGEYP